jgi:aspartate/methionine/tyrosine aminotransferase
MDESLSQRGLKASKTVLRVDMDLYFEAAQNLYDKKSNPLGTFPMNIAENKLNWSMLREKIQQISGNNDIPDWVAGYTSGLGAPSFRESIAAFLEKFLTKCQINPEDIAFSAGATSVVEMTCLVLGDPGDVVAIPAPAYSVYKQDVGNIAGLERYDIVTHHDMESLIEGPLLDISHLDTTKEVIEKDGKTFKILALTNPDNPTGGIYTYDQLLNITNWCLHNQVHLIVNEIYGLSLIDTSHPAIRNDYSGQVDFVSFAQIMEEKKSDYLHLWYSFSKDFGISGLRVGFVHSLNQLFIQAYENLNYSHLVSNHTQWIIQELLKDDQFIQEYIDTNQKLLTEAYVTVVTALKKIDVPYVPSRGSLFIWLDLSEFIENNSQEAENTLWLDIYKMTGILLTPGEGFGHSKKGLFRMVYPYFKKEDLQVAMERLREYVDSRRH